MLSPFFHNSSILCVWLSSIAAFILPLAGHRNLLLKTICTLLTLVSVSLIIYLGGRAALIGFMAAAIFVNRKSNVFVFLRRRLLLFAVLTLTVLVLLFYSKYGSSSGRMHIYKISLQILKDNWIKGTGLGKFKATFNEYQADYFMQHGIDSQRALLADNTFYAFNDYLQWTIETGILGTTLLAFFFLWLFKRIVRLCVVYKNHNVLMGAIAALICILSAAFFSYPFHVLPVQLIAIVWTAIIIFFPDRMVFREKTHRQLRLVIRLVLVLFFAFFLFYSFFHIRTKRWEKEAFRLSIAGKKSEALMLYRKLAAYYPAYGHNKYLYAEQCYYMNQLQRADSILAETKRLYIDSRVYTLKAKIEFETGRIQEAEKSYLRAIYMVPNRMTARYELMNYYLAVGDTAKAKDWAHSILNMLVKVASPKAEIIKREVSKLPK